MLDTAIGLVLVYLLLSLICSSVSEGIESFFKYRARDLERGLRELLQDPKGVEITQHLYNHPLINGLFRGNYDPTLIRWKGQDSIYRSRLLPSYVPAQNFALALMDLILPSSAQSLGGAAGALGTGQETVPAVELVQALRDAALRHPLPAVSKGVVTIADASLNSMVTVREGIEQWFNSGMDRVSGWYKRRAQRIIFAVALSTAVALNLDTFAIANRLVLDAPLRSSLVTVSQEYGRQQARESLDRTLDRLEKLNLPIGWQHLPQRPDYWILKVAGILASALAATLGAPFWFDTLNRFIVVRSTVKPREKSVEERSKD